MPVAATPLDVSYPSNTSLFAAAVSVPLLKNPYAVPADAVTLPFWKNPGDDVVPVVENCEPLNVPPDTEVNPANVVLVPPSVIAVVPIVVLPFTQLGAPAPPDASTCPDVPDVNDVVPTAD